MAVALAGEAVSGCGCGMRRGEGVQVVAKEVALWDPYPGSPDPGYPDNGGSYDDYVVGAIGCSGYWGKIV